MKYLWSILFLLFPLVTFGQGDFYILKKELDSYTQNDTVAVLGSICSECDGFFQSRYYLATATKGRLIVIDYLHQQDKYKKVFDSSFDCNECSAISGFIKNNYQSISNQFDSTIYLFTYKTIKGTDTTFTIDPTIGLCYFLGLYTKNNFTYSFFSKHQNINHIFENGYYCWTYFNLLKNQFPNIDL